MKSTLEINRVAFCRDDLATCTANLSPVEQPPFLLLLHKTATAHPASSAEEILLGYQLWKIKAIWTFILNLTRRGRIVAQCNVWKL